MDKVIWRDFVASVRTEGQSSPSRKSAAGIKKSIKTLTQTGPQKDGSPFKNVKDPLEDKDDEKDISAPPGAPGGGAVGNPGPVGLEEDDEIIEQARSSHLNRVKSYTKDRDELLNVGGNKNTAPYTKKMSKHVTFDKQTGNIEEEAGPESFDMHNTLEPRIWNSKEQMSPAVRKKLLKIAQDFIDGLPVEVNVEDITLTGSLANFNWSNYSDVDLHIIVEFLSVDENTALVKGFFDNARMKWNNKHDISMKGYDVEIYVEDSAEKHQSSGIYSVLNGDWVVRPKRKDVDIDFPAARRKSEDIEFQINIVKNLITAKKFEVASRNIERLKRKIRNMRSAGLESAAREFSVENIAFKLLRRNGALAALENLKNDLYDDMMSVKEE